nr:SCO1664 family protein [Naumannella cuiyingiana]
MTIRGRLTTASNATFLVQVGDRLAVHKPVRGERPLHDFPDGTLAAREVAAYRLSSLAGFDLVPATVLVDGPLGPGSLQAWVDEADYDLVDLISEHDDLAGRLPVMDGFGAADEPVLVVHADDDRLRRLAVFDVVINNADRKGGHILTREGRVFAVDHGVCFHTQDKLRTVLWGFAGEPLTDEHRALVAAARDAAGELSGLLSAAEVAAVAARAEALLAAGVLPEPAEHRFPFPWPPF